MSAKFLRYKYGLAYYEADCLGWCKKKLVTSVPVNDRYCKRCRRIKENNERSLSRTGKIFSDISYQGRNNGD